MKDGIEVERETSADGEKELISLIGQPEGTAALG